jgi:hypothetical protein
MNMRFKRWQGWIAGWITALTVAETISGHSNLWGSWAGTIVLNIALIITWRLEVSVESHIRAEANKYE